MTVFIDGERLPDAIGYDLGDGRLSLRGDLSGDIIRLLSRLGDGTPRVFRVEGDGVVIQTKARLALRITSGPRGSCVEAQGAAEPIRVEEAPPHDGD